MKNRLWAVGLLLLSVGAVNRARGEVHLEVGGLYASYGNGDYSGGHSTFRYGLLVGSWGWGQYSGTFDIPYIVTGFFQLESGKFVHSTPGQSWDFAPGGTFTLEGEMHSQLTNDLVLSERTLLTGRLSSVVVPIGYPYSGTTMEINIAEASADDQALDLLGLPHTKYKGDLQLDIINTWATTHNDIAIPPEPFTMPSGNVVLMELRPVPEPSSWLLLSTVAGSVGLFRFAKKRETRD